MTTVLLGFADESGRAGQTDFVSMAFWVGRWMDWCVFRDRWVSVLARHGAPYLHMREFAHCVGVFKGWTESQRRNLMADCLSCLDGVPLLSFVAAVRVRDFEGLPPNIRNAVRDPYFACYQECLYAMAVIGYLGFPGDRVNLVYSRQDEFAGEFKRLFEWERGLSDGGRLGVLAFGDMKTSPGLQLADLSAYELLHYYQRKQDAPDAAPRHPLLMLCRHQERLAGPMFKLVPSWLMILRTGSHSAEVMKAMLMDFPLWEDMLNEMIPEPARFPGHLQRARTAAAESAIADAYRSWRRDGSAYAWPEAGRPARKPG